MIQNVMDALRLVPPPPPGVESAEVEAQLVEGAGAPLINGQYDPKLTIEVGEVQRWRFISATTQLQTMITIKFPPGWDVKQIAQDGIQFAAANYEDQPLLVEKNQCLRNRPGAGKPCGFSRPQDRWLRDRDSVGAGSSAFVG